MGTSKVRIDKITLMVNTDSITEPKQPNHLMYDVIATVSYENSKSYDNRRKDNLSSGGVFGIESDANLVSLYGEIKDQINELQKHLKMFGIEDQFVIDYTLHHVDYLGASCQVLGSVELYNHEWEATNDAGRTVSKAKA